MLKIALMSNVIFSFTSAMLMLLLGSLLGSYIPLPSWLWTVLGLGLLVFALDLSVLAVMPKWAMTFTPWVVAADIAWVLLTLVALLIFWAELSSTGVAMITAVNVVVAVLAWAQYAAHKAQSTD